MNATILRFGYPATLIREYRHWLVLLRPSQPTLGSLVLAAKSDATAFAGLEPDAYTELGPISRDIDAALAAAVDCAKLNYMMLMMVDPHVHFHVIPRYEGSRTFGTIDFPDVGWPKLPDLNAAVSLDDNAAQAVAAMLTSVWLNSQGGR